MDFAWFLFLLLSTLTFHSYVAGTLALHPAVLMAIGLLLFLLSLRTRSFRRWFPAAALLLSASAFHGVSGSDWSLILYLLLCARMAVQRPQSVRVPVLFIGGAVCFSCVFVILAYPLKVEEALRLLLALLAFAGAYMLCKRWNSYVSSINGKGAATSPPHRDVLTGLMNIQDFYEQLDTLVQNRKKPFLLFLLDCTDLKTMNNELGFHYGNEILKKISMHLRELFPEAHAIARTGGDEFALALRLTRPTPSDQLDQIRHMLTHTLAEQSGVQITFGAAMFPQDAITCEDLILVAENQLFAMKQENWRKKEEQILQSEKLRVVGELASGMAHEIRNPLTTIRGFLQLSKSNGYVIQPWYELIMDEIQRMSELTMEFLQVSKPRTSGQAESYKALALQDCVQRVIQLAESEAVRLGHAIEYEPPDKPVAVWMDQDKIVQLLMNLVKNAFEAMDRGGKVGIRLLEDEEWAILEVRDTGAGIPDNMQKSIFQPFVTTKEHGTGLGLSICSKIVKEHNGTIAVSSAPGQGTVFTIRLPRARKPVSVPAARSNN